MWLLNNAENGWGLKPAKQALHFYSENFCQIFLIAEKLVKAKITNLRKAKNILNRTQRGFQLWLYRK